MNNYQLHLKEIKEIEGRPSLLIHICCGVCSVYPILYLRKYFNLTLFFTNSNIYPYEEFEKRLGALEQYLDVLKDDSIKLIVAPYRNNEFNRKLLPYAKDPEGKRRCVICYTLRMEETFKYASDNGYDYCTTVMSISNKKNAEYINTIGEKLQKLYPDVKYLHADFKKGDGITENEKLNKKLGLYHQNYCGCIYSIRKK